MACLFGHKWNGCVCSKCGEKRNEEHKWNGCKCEICGTVNDEFHKWIDNEKGIVICSFCKEKRIKMAYFDTGMENLALYMLMQAVLMKSGVNVDLFKKGTADLLKGYIHADAMLVVFMAAVNYLNQKNQISADKYEQIYKKAQEINEKLSLGLTFERDNT